MDEELIRRESKSDHYVSTNVIVSAVDIGPDSFATHITGEFWARYRNSLETPEYTTPSVINA